MRRYGSLLLLLVLTAAACGGSDGGFARDVPGGSDQVVLRVDTQPGFVPMEYALASFPGFTLYGDGRILTEGAQIEIYPQPALPPVIVREVTARAIDRIVTAAIDAGLDRDARYDNPMVADAATTVFTLTVDGRTYTTSVYALGLEGSGVASSDDEAARQKIAAFHAKLGDLASWLPEEELGSEAPYDLDGLRIFVQPYSRDGLDEQLEQPAKDWPLSDQPLGTFGTKGDLARCGTVTGADAEAVISAARDANQLTPWRSGGEEWKLVFRPLLPDESGC